MLVWRSASRLPTVIVSAASTQNSGCQTSLADGKATNTSSSRATKPAAFDATDRNAVTGVGALVGVGRPRVERHRRHLEGEADDDEHDAERPSILGCRRCAEVPPMSVSSVEPVTPYSSDMP